MCIKRNKCHSLTMSSKTIVIVQTNVTLWQCMDKQMPCFVTECQTWQCTHKCHSLAMYKHTNVMGLFTNNLYCQAIYINIIDLQMSYCGNECLNKQSCFAMSIFTYYQCHSFSMFRHIRIVRHTQALVWLCQDIVLQAIV